MKLCDLKPRVVRLLDPEPVNESERERHKRWRERNRERSRQLAREGYHRRKQETRA
jgi:hypothetical protein